MIDVESIINAESDETLKELKMYLFKENIRLENEQRRINEENLFLDKKLKMVTDGFKKLDADKMKLEKDKTRFYKERELFRKGCSNVTVGMNQVVSILFRRVNNPLALRKRYKDLLKIFHPDNACGDAELVQMLNMEYERRKKAE